MIRILFYFCLLIQFVAAGPLFAQSYKAEVLKYSSVVEVNKNNLSQTDSVVIQINNRSGDKYTKISIPYSKFEKISRLEAWIEDMHGNVVRKLKKNEVKDESSISDFSLYEDNFNKIFQLKHNVYPYKVFYTYKKNLHDFITIAYWNPIIYNSAPTKLAILKTILPKELKYHIYSNLISSFKKDSTEESIILKWQASYKKPPRPEIFSQPDELTPYVIVAPLKFYYGVEGSLQNWETFGNWQYRLNQGLDVLPDEEKKTVSNIIRGITDKREIVRKLYHYMQDNTRYVNVSIGIGGLKPYPASYVATNKYGDCKALSNYMKALLGYAGIKSFYTKIEADDQPEKLIKEFAGPQFNHIILAVPLDGDTIWLENTENTNPFGYLGTFTQNRNALLVSENHSHLVHIPALKAEDNRNAFSLNYDLNINGDSNVKMNISFKGDEFELFNNLHSEFNDHEKDQIIRSYMPFDNYEVQSWNLTKPDRDTARIELSVELRLSKFLKSLGKEYYFNSLPCRIPPFTAPSARSLPVELPYPICNSEKMIYSIPAGYEMKNKSDTVSIASKYGSYNMMLSEANGKIRQTKRFELFPANYSLEEYHGFYTFIQSVKKIDRMKIILKPKE